MCTQASRSEMLVFLNREGRGAPAARLRGGALGTSYRFGLGPGVRLLGDTVCDRGFRKVRPGSWADRRRCAVLSPVPCTLCRACSACCTCMPWRAPRLALHWIPPRAWRLGHGQEGSKAGRRLSFFLPARPLLLCAGPVSAPGAGVAGIQGQGPGLYAASEASWVRLRLCAYGAGAGSAACLGSAHCQQLCVGAGRPPLAPASIAGAPC